MPQWLVGLFSILSGLTAIGTGSILATLRFRKLLKTHARRTRLLALHADGWGSWFARGFTDMTLGTRLLQTSVMLAAWILLGAWLAGLGLQLAL
jgi:hypothetical protein